MKLRIGLSPKDVKKALAQAREYQKQLNNKNALFVERLAETGIPIIKGRMAASRGDSNPAHSTEIRIYANGDKVEGTLTLSGEDILFFEFGSGVYYNASDPPHASDFGYGVGTYPGQTHAFDSDGWWYRDEANQLHHSYGTEATMPMLKASEEIISNIRKIAREVYGS